MWRRDGARAATRPSGRSSSSRAARARRSRRTAPSGLVGSIQGVTEEGQAGAPKASEAQGKQSHSNGSGAGTAIEAVSAFGAALIKGAEAKPADTADPLVSAAFALGWHMSELYAKHLPVEKRVPPDLPGLGSLSDKQRIAILIDQVEAGVNQLSNSITKAGLDAIDLTALKGLRQSGPTDDPVLQTHEKLLDELTAVDFRLGKAYGLGRALADSCRRPSDLPTLKEQLDPYRIANLLSWLDDLETAFPPHAASSVNESLGRWRDALYPPPQESQPANEGGWRTWPARLKRAQVRADGSPEVSAGTASASGPAQAPTEQMAAIAPGVDPEKTLRALRRQGELWRALLSGEKQGADMLEIENYLDAAQDLVSRAAIISRGVVRRMPMLSALIAVLLGGGVALLILGSTTQLVGGVTSILAAVGLTWKSLGGALGQLVGKLERPLWGAVLDDAIADAITLLPNNAAEKGGRRRVAIAMSAGPKPRSADHA